MGSIASLDSLINLSTGGGAAAPQHLVGFKIDRVAGAAPASMVSGRYTSLWQYGGSQGPGAAPGGSVRNPTNNTNGALKFTSPGGGRTLWSVSRGFTALAAGTYQLHDRLLDISGLSATVTTAQTVGGTLTRNTNGDGNEILVEIFTQIGATPTTITASYTNQAGTAGRITEAVTFGGTNAREAQRIIKLPLQAGDKGVRSVQSVTVLATTGTAGDFGLVVSRPLCSLNVGASGRGDVDSRIIQIDDAACLWWVVMAGTSTPPAGPWDISLVEA
jgi:hypothetical protein